MREIQNDKLKQIISKENNIDLIVINQWSKPLDLLSWKLSQKFNKKLPNLPKKFIRHFYNHIDCLNKLYVNNKKYCKKRFLIQRIIEKAKSKNKNILN